MSDIIFIPDSIRLIAGFLSALIITYVSVPTIIKISDYKQLYAFANERTSHTAQTPTLGGLAVFAGFTLAVIIFSHRDAAPELAYILGALITIFFIGLKDDILVIDPRKTPRTDSGINDSNLAWQIPVVRFSSCFWNWQSLFHDKPYFHTFCFSCHY